MAYLKLIKMTLKLHEKYFGGNCPFFEGIGSLDNGYLDNFYNEFLNKYNKILKNRKKNLMMDMLFYL
jgi:hypothetical protein